MKYLHLYNNQTDYDNEKNTLILPSASLIEKNNKVEYSPHQYVEINGVKWATMNVGAKSIYDYGCLYFQWGDTQGYTSGQVGTNKEQKEFKWSDYSKFTMDGGKTFTKYNSADTKTVLDLEDDAVHAAWGGSWRMPTSGDFQTLHDAVITAWTSDYQGSKVAGMVCKDINTQKELLFFPACGNADDSSVDEVGSGGDYWSSSLNSNDVSCAYSFNFNFGSVIWHGENDRCSGFAVRGVWDDKLTKSNQ